MLGSAKAETPGQRCWACSPPENAWAWYFWGPGQPPLAIPHKPRQCGGSQGEPRHGRPACALTLNPPERPEDPSVEHGDHGRDDDGSQRRFGDVVEERGEVRQREQHQGACGRAAAPELGGPRVRGGVTEAGSRHWGWGERRHSPTCDQPPRRGADARLCVHCCPGTQGGHAVPSATRRPQGLRCTGGRREAAV